MPDEFSAKLQARLSAGFFAVLRLMRMGARLGL
jgi:hypothetical protein